MLLTSIARRTVATAASRNLPFVVPIPSSSASPAGVSVRNKSQSAVAAATEDVNVNDNKDEVVGFPSDEKGVEIPVLLNSKKHAVGYLSKVLNARVYEASVETELQHAKNLSAVSCESHAEQYSFLNTMVPIIIINGHEVF